jgi:hypothetical protein
MALREAGLNAQRQWLPLKAALAFSGGWRSALRM